jgi:hypothetical protein
MFSWEIFGVWLAAALTIAIYSFLYKDNPIYKIAEHIFVGVSAGYIVCMAYYQVIKPNLLEEIPKGNYIVLLPAVLGIMMYSRFFPKISWVSRISIAFTIAITAGISVPNTIQATIIRQISATIGPLVSDHGFNINAFIVILGVSTVLIYFFFSIEPGKVLKTTSWIGIIYLMIFFGASFGYTVMGRVSLVIGRMRFLILDWWPLVMRIFHSGT